MYKSVKARYVIYRLVIINEHVHVMINVHVMIKVHVHVHVHVCIYLFICLQVFMRNSQKRILQDHLESKVLSKIVLIQLWVRAKLHRCRFLLLRRSVIILQVLPFLPSSLPPPSSLPLSPSFQF